jgi:hypothetical protein
VAWAGKGAGLIVTGRPLGFYKLGVRLRLRHRQAILPEAFKIHGDRATNILVQLLKRGGSGYAPGQVRNVRGIIPVRFLNDDEVFYRVSPSILPAS